MDDPDLELPWILARERRDQPGARPRLDPPNLFLLACREAYADGDVTTVENQMLRRFVTALGLSADDASKLAKLAHREFVEGRAVGSGGATLPKVFMRACSFAWVDGQVDDDERALLERFGTGLGLTSEQVARTLERAQAARAGGGDPGAAPEEPKDTRVEIEVPGSVKFKLEF